MSDREKRVKELQQQVRDAKNAQIKASIAKTKAALERKR